MYQRFHEFCSDIKWSIQNNDFSYCAYNKYYPEDVDDDTVYWFLDDIENIIQNMGHNCIIKYIFNPLYRIIEDEKVIWDGTCELEIDDSSKEFLDKLSNTLLSEMNLTNIYITKFNETDTIFIKYKKIISFEELKNWKGN